MNSDYLSVVGFLMFAGFLATVGLLANYFQKVENEERAARRDSEK
ncbi:MAG: hypothetical protein QOJ98_2868 [Acidobacteriota bacterium]|jgi:hypothetical protein|nr:hypothetical protein [Acidobacteriota bacterium]